MSKSSSNLSKVARSFASGAVLASLSALDAVTIGSALAQSKPAQPSPTTQRLEGLQRVEQERRSAEDAKWRSFPGLEPDWRTGKGWLFDVQPQHLRQKCAFYWPGWKLRPDETRFTAVRGCFQKSVAVDCKFLKVSWLSSAHRANWSSWSVPSPQEETGQMVAELCDNITSSGVHETGSKTFASYTPAQPEEVDYRETFVQSPQGWRLVGININASVWWIKPSTVKGTAADRSVLKLSLDPDRPARLSESRVHINCITAQQQQSHPLKSQVRTPPLAINQGSTWESIALIICPAGTYATGLRPNT